MVLAELWLQDRMRKNRAKCFQKALAQAKAEGCAEGFTDKWTRGYAKGHERAHAMGYDKYDAEAYAVGYAESVALIHPRWEAWLRRREDAKAKGIPFDEPSPKAED